MKILDLHAHVLPGVDDGSRSEQESVAMLRNAYASRVEILVATPHCNFLPHWHNYTDTLQPKYQQLTELSRSAGIPIQLMPGAEVRATPELPLLLKAGRIMTLNGGKYLLTEFSTQAEPAFFAEILQQILQAGFIPLVAHPERYSAVCRDSAIVGQWLDMGCHVQLTGASILGKFGPDAKHAADYLLRNKMTACVASDAHGAHRRTNYLMDVYDHLSLHYSKGCAQALMWEIPLRICGSEIL